MATFPSLSFVCPIRWSEMRGDEKERFCSKCSRTVVNISLLTEAQRVDLLSRTSPEQLCVAYYRRLSGEFVSAENPLQPAERRSLLQYGAAALSAGALAAAVGNFDPAPNPTLIKAKNEITAAYETVKWEVESRTKEIVENLSSPFFPKKEPPVFITLGAVACLPEPTPGSGSASSGSSVAPTAEESLSAPAE
jgi:hypothetical protein